MSTPSPKSPEPSERNKKYDRQLRLWGDHGQNRLEQAKVCLINATALGTEILKSLVLPGIGAFTIVDGDLVTEEDIGTNFFLEVENIGESRAQATTRLLLELNTDVRGDYIDGGLDEILKDNPDFFASFDIVVATAVPEKYLISLSKTLWDMDVPLLICRSVGFQGYLRVQVHEHTIVETHPDNEVFDLRLDRPFPALLEHLNGIDVDSMDLKEHSHVPYLVVLYKYIEKWKKSTGKPWPSSYSDKSELREMIRKGIRTDENGVPIGEENFEEAIKGVNSCLSLTDVPVNVQNVFNDESCVNLTQKSEPFWIMARALKEFVENEGEGCLPISGTLPDMTADTNGYITLQQLYHRQATACADIVHRRVRELLHELGQPIDLIDERETHILCKHSRQLHVTRGSKIANEYSVVPSPHTCAYIANHLENPDSMIVNYIMLRGLERFFTEHSTYPGELDDQVEPDIVKLKACVSKLLNEWGCPPLSKDDFVHEMCRYGGAELHSVSAFLGGCVAHEAIKFITKQYKPVDNTLIFDAITSNTATYTF